jgi:hypothetical protein
LAAHDFAPANEFDTAHVGVGMDDDLDDLDDLDEVAEESESAGAGAGAGAAEEPPEPFVPLGSEDPIEDAGPPAGRPLSAHKAIARSLQAPAAIPRVLRKEARSFFDGAMYAYTEGDLPGARLTFLAVAGIGDADTAPAAMVFLGVIAYRHRDVPEARMWFTRAAAGADEHWARVAAEELRRVG